MTSVQSRLASVVALVGLAVALALVLSSSDEVRQKVVVTVDDADSLIPGQNVKLGGLVVGRVDAVDAVDGGRRARVRIAFTHGRALPLRADARLELRWGGTVKFASRYLVLHPGSATSPTVPDGGTLATAALTVPTEIDQLVATFDADARSDLRAFINESGEAFALARTPLRRTLDVAPGALTELGSTLTQVVEDEDRFETLVRAASDTVSAIDAADPGLRSLLAGAGSTFAATAAEADALKDMLAGAPATFADVRDTLHRADPTLATTGSVVERLGPGVAELRRLTRPLNGVLRTVADVAPIATRTLADARRATTHLDPLLSTARGLMPDLDSIGDQLTDELPCLRPYTPDIVSFFTNWGDFISSTDVKDHYFRAYPQAFLPAPANTQPMTAGEAAKVFTGLRMAFPRPPGANAGKPWFQPACGVTQDAFDPEKDPEARRPFPSSMRIPDRKPVGR